LINTCSGKHREKALHRFTSQGIEPERVEFLGGRPWNKYIQLYEQIDIALDPFPYGGGITTCDGLWMGVPIVTLSGRTAVGRGGRSLLNNVGLPELVASDVAEYQRIAINLAADVDRLGEIRAGLRERMNRSPLMDAAAFARDFQAVYRQLWQTWCSAPARPNGEK
jgi:predicted O-linked N-acetylglucosamine transferase (SPINDLY family)